MGTKPKSALFARFKTDEDREENGVWVDFGDDIKVKVRRFKSRASQDARKELEKPHQDVIRRGGLSEEQAQELLLRQMAKAIIVDWQGVTDEKGEPLPCTEDAKYSILKALPEFRDEVFGISIDRDAFKAKVDADAEGNS
ncbi:hypothetical protein [Microcystis phage Mwe-JY26]